MTQETKRPMSVTEKEQKLIELLREVRFGELHLYIADGQPVRLEEIKKSIKL